MLLYKLLTQRDTLPVISFLMNYSFSVLDLLALQGLLHLESTEHNIL